MEAMALANMQTRLKGLQEVEKQTKKYVLESIVFQSFLNPIINHGTK